MVGSSYLTALLEAALVLLAFAGLAYALLRARSLRELFSPKGKLLAIEERLPIDAKSALLVVRVEGRRLLLATHQGSSARLVTELSEAPLPAQAAPIPAREAFEP